MIANHYFFVKIRCPIRGERDVNECADANDGLCTDSDTLREGTLVHPRVSARILIVASSNKPRCRERALHHTPIAGGIASADI